FSSRRRHTRCYRDWSSDVCSSDLELQHLVVAVVGSGSIRVLDVTLLVLESNDPNDPVGVLVLDRELTRDPPGGGIRASLLLGIRSEERRVGKECSTETL